VTLTAVIPYGCEGNPYVWRLYVCYAIGVYGLPHCSGDRYSVRVCVLCCRCLRLASLFRWQVQCPCVCVCYAVGVYGLPHCSGDRYSVRVCVLCCRCLRLASLFWWHVQCPCVCCAIGVYGLPHCSGDTYTVCNYVRKLLTLGAYLE